MSCSRLNPKRSFDPKSVQEVLNQTRPVVEKPCVASFQMPQIVSMNNESSPFHRLHGCNNRRCIYQSCKSPSTKVQTQRTQESIPYQISFANWQDTSM